MERDAASKAARQHAATAKSWEDDKAQEFQLLEERFAQQMQIQQDGHKQQIDSVRNLTGVREG